ncbi:MAG: hypothetical protein IJC66_11455 [Kiritimatiellae bacterium]|nr:hypothetical protein [Kiritimatiellia bacterium]
MSSRTETGFCYSCALLGIGLYFFCMSGLPAFQAKATVTPVGAPPAFFLRARVK